MTVETLVDYVLNDPLGTLVQIPAILLLIGGPIWLIRRVYIKNKKIIE